ncbi:hypothetical protein AAG614_01305 [Citromicrobium bathyomarinum]
MSDTSPTLSILESLSTAINEWNQAVDSLGPCPPDDPRAGFEQLNRVLVQFDRVLDEIRKVGAAEIADGLRLKLASTLDESMRRSLYDIPIGERRALVASVLRSNRYALPIAGTRDTPMHRAMAATDLFLATSDEAGPEATEAEWTATFLRLYDAMIDDDPDATYERVRKSIGRFKKRLRATPLYRFDGDRLRFVAVDFEEAAHGLSERKGRPSKTERDVP